MSLRLVLIFLLLQKTFASTFDVNQINYLLYTKYANEPFTFKLDNFDPQDLIKNGFDPEKDTKILAHGWAVDAKFFADQFSGPYKGIKF